MIRSTYWQSDGSAPHFVNIQFLKKSAVTKLCFYLNFTIDESYTPKKIQVKAGNTLHDLFDLTTIELDGPVGNQPIMITKTYNDMIRKKGHKAIATSLPIILFYSILYILYIYYIYIFYSVYIYTYIFIFISIFIYQ